MLKVLDFKQDYRIGREPVDMVLVAPAGPDFEKTQTWHRVSKLKPRETDDPAILDSMTHKDMVAKWSVIGPRYEAWKRGHDIPETGTPLAAWAGVTAEQARHLREMGINTVEDVRDMGDAAAEKLRIPNARKLPQMAKRWLEGEAVAEKDAKIAEMEERLAVMAELLEERMKPEEDKPRRGRPPKAKEDEAA